MFTIFKNSEKCAEYTECTFGIGFTNQDYEGTFIWKNNIENSKYTNWGTNEPNNGGDEDCAVLFRLFTNERVTYAHIWCPFVKWIQQLFFIEFIKKTK